MIIEVVGSEATKIINNLTTNDISKLGVGQRCETFVTDVRGWTVAHGFVLKEEHRILLIGQHPSPQLVCNHIDRYIIREDARVNNLSDSHQLVLVDSVQSSPGEGWSTIPAPIISPSSQLWFGPTSAIDANTAFPALPQINDQYDYRRIHNFWPLMGRDIGDKCIPQELDRDPLAISFTKGCYLGQETIARLDARGQLQKKLCRLNIDTEGIEPQTPITNGEKEVGFVTSAAFNATDQTTFALAFLKRGNFEPGTRLLCGNATATVLESTIRA